MDSKRYIKFFNYGYFLSKFEPQFLKKLLNATANASDVHESLKAGRSEYNKEQVLDKLKNLSKSSDIDQGKERGIEPDI